MPSRWVAWSGRRDRAFPPEVFETEAEARAAYAAAMRRFADMDDAVYIGHLDRDGSDCRAVCVDGPREAAVVRTARLVAAGKVRPTDQ